MSQLISALPYGAALVDLQGRVITVNRYLAHMCGIEDGQFRSRPLDELLNTVLSDESPWLPTGHWPQYRESLARKPVRGLVRGSTQSHVSIALAAGRWGKSVITFAPSMPGYQSGTLNALLRTASAGVFILDADGHILTCNDLARELGPEDDGTFSEGHPRNRCIDLYLNVTQKGSPFPIVDQIDRAQRENRDLTFAADLKASPTPERELDVALSIAPIESSRIPDLGGEDTPQSPEGVVLFVRDVSDKKQLSRDVQRLQHARQISRAAGGIAHELNNSATALMAHLGLLERGLQNTADAVRDELKSAESAVRRITRLGQQLERFSGHRSAGVDSDESGPVLPLSAVLLSEIIQDTAALAISGTGVRSSFAIDGGLPEVRISAEAISQALFNVVINAVEAMEEDGLIHFSVCRCRDPEAVVVGVRDEGHGMDPRMVSQVTRPYFSTKPQGVGMGLTVTLSTLESAGGTLEIETDPGFGTTVRLYLPILASLPERLSPALPDATEATDFHGFRVLLVEDDPLVRRSLERTLQSMGCIVTAADSGDRAIEVFRSRVGGQEQFQLVITDLTMPGRNDGVQLLRRIRELDPMIPAVLSSGALHRQNTSSYREAGFQYVLRKPFGEAEVRVALSVALAR